MVAKLALRLVDTPCSYLVFEALSKGKKVIAASDALNQGETSTKIGAIEVEYVNLLSELGVELVPMMQNCRIRHGENGQSVCHLGKVSD